MQTPEEIQAMRDDVAAMRAELDFGDGTTAELYARLALYFRRFVEITYATAATQKEILLNTAAQAHQEVCEALADSAKLEAVVQSGLDTLFLPDLESRAEAKVRLARERAAPEGSEAALALLFSRCNVGHMGYGSERGEWFVFNGAAWARDVSGRAREAIRHAGAGVAADAVAKGAKSVTRYGASRFLSGALSIAEGMIPIPLRRFDANPWLLGTPGSYVDLKTGKLREARVDDYVSKLTSVTPAKGEPKLWLKFLWEITGGNNELIDYLQKIGGYFLTGHTKEEKLFFLYGDGQNGKSVFVKTLRALMGDYARAAAPDFLTETRFERHPTSIAELAGARLVTASEIEQGKRWNESLVKGIVSGEELTARFMNRDNFSFFPVGKLLVSGNHVPELKNVGPDMMRRLVVIPFAVNIPDERRDPELVDKLATDRPQILQWLIEGCLAWQRDGLAEPPAVAGATLEYFEAEDVIRDWIRERLVMATAAEDAFLQTTDAFNDWSEWCEARGEKPGTHKRFVTRLKKAGVVPGFNTARTKRGFHGVRLA